MSGSAADGSHEFVVAPELAEVAERLGVPLHAGDRVRFEVIDGEREAAPRRRRLGWLGTVSTGSTPRASGPRTTSATGLAVALTEILVDAGPLNAGFDDTDVRHDECSRLLKSLRGLPPTAP